MKSLNTQILKTDALLLLTSIIWGFAFVAQRIGMDYVGPFTFNGVRFALGGLVLIPFIVRNNRVARRSDRNIHNVTTKDLIVGGGLAGLALFAGASFQQVGLVYTTAGNAGFITGLYVVIVPILGLIFKQRTNTGSWLGVLAAACGLYFLCITEKFTIARGDFLELAGAIFWATQILIIGWLSPRMNPLKLAAVQYTACSILSLIAAFLIEEITMNGIYLAAIPIFYGGALSVGVAYTLQVVAQRKAHPAHAAILLSLEAVFAVLGGWLVLGEILTPRGVLGCGLMLTGMLLSQLWGMLYKSDSGTPPVKNVSS
jgi:drug/metabolite transporter (DMT)-like permease